MKQFLLHKKFEWKLYLYCFTIPPLHWDALGVRRLLCKVYLNSMTHYIIQVGNFFGSFFFICISFGHGFENDSVVFRVNFQLFFLPLQLGFAFLNASGFTPIIKYLNIWQTVPLFAVPQGPSYQCSTNMPFWHQSGHFLSFSVSLIIFNFGNFRRARPNSFLPKKYMNTFPHLVFSPFSGHLLFLDCLMMCCSECL